MLRLAAGLGQVHRETPRGEFGKQFLHADVAVIGGGPAGISAAQEAAERGARVLLFDENSALGGQLQFYDADLPKSLTELRSEAFSNADGSRNFRHAALESATYASQMGRTMTDFQTPVASHPNITVLTDTVVLGWYDDNWLAAVQDARLLKIRATSLVLATGAYEMPLVFDNNDLPGVMLGSAVQRLLRLYGVAPGKRAMVMSANDDGWQVAADLERAGIEIAAIVEERARVQCTSPLAAALSRRAPVFWAQTIKQARGKGAVSGAVIGERTIECELIAVSVGWTPASDLIHQAGGKSEYNIARGEILPTTFPPGIFAAGRVMGTHNVNGQRIEGRLAGWSAAAFAGFGDAPTDAERAQQKPFEPLRTSTRVKVAGSGKRFLCYREDVTDHDLEISVEEGDDNIELLKRYSTISMGPCQGKMCALNTIHLCARANRATVRETGTTTARPPIIPLKLGALAGQNLESV